MSSEDTFVQKLEASKRASVGQLLFRCARLFNERALSEVRTYIGQPGLRAAHLALFAHIDLEGTRLTEIARRQQVSKQAVGQLVSELEAMGTLERVPDPSDGRARLVRFSTEGKASMLEGLSMLRKMERVLGDEIGGANMAQLHELLLLLLPVLEEDTYKVNLEA